jgi:hypothetical protein
VFGQPASSDVVRVLTCLFEKNLEFELVRIDTFKTYHKLPEFVRLWVCYFHHLFLVYFKFSNKFEILLIPFVLCRIQMGK